MSPSLIALWLHAAHTVSGRDEDYCYHKMPFARVMSCVHVWMWKEGVKCVPVGEEELDDLF